MKTCCCSCPCTDECPCKSPCDCSKCIWEIKIKSKKDITTYDYLLDGLLLSLKDILSSFFNIKVFIEYINSSFDIS